MAIDDKKASIRLVAMGGTIAFGPGLDGAEPSLDGSALAHTLGAEGVDLEPVDLVRISSIGLRDHHLLELAKVVEDTIDGESAGMIITHGTDTLEETAYFLALTCRWGRIPIVLTGAMRHSGDAGSDGPSNLQAALAVARTAAAASVGPVVVMADEIHTARFVTKYHATRIAAFRSPANGPIGHVLEGKATIWYRPAYTDHLARIDGASLPRVEIVTMSLAASPATLHAVVDTVPDGLVIEGFGGGHVAPELLDAVDRARQLGIPTIVASRCADGTTLQQTYAVPGTEIDLQRRGAVMAGTLSAVKARLRLMVAIAAGIPVDEVFPAL
ncbi:MAG: asparaginase/glutaminase [Ilumatobacteraceae bacterium]|nr:asparaginase/glutaminase [Ilumatobacteraceae bacterium]